MNSSRSFLHTHILVNLFGIMQKDSVLSLCINLTTLFGLRGIGEAMAQLEINGQYLEHWKISV